VQRAADRVSGESTEIERLLNDSLAGKRGVTMDEQRHAAFALAVAGAILLGTHATQRNRRDEFHVARIKAERQVNFMPGTDLVVGAVSKMILDVASMIL
jgi:glutamine amidotransferase PdxT